MTKIYTLNTFILVMFVGFMFIGTESKVWGKYPKSVEDGMPEHLEPSRVVPSLSVFLPHRPSNTDIQCIATANYD